MRHFFSPLASSNARGVMSYYAVAHGRKPGVYRTWTECKANTDGVLHARFKKFTKLEEAEAFVESGGAVLSILSQLGAEASTIRDRPAVLTAKPPHDGDDAIVAFVDGACSGNGTRHARAGYAVVFPSMERTVAEPLFGANQTNNRAEYMAAIRALELSAELDPSGRKTLFIYTDSMLLLNSATRWMATWKRSGWKKKDGKAVLNVDLLMRLDELTARRQVSWKHVSAHTGGVDWASRWNDAADKAARGVVEAARFPKPSIETLFDAWERGGDN